LNVVPKFILIATFLLLAGHPCHAQGDPVAVVRPCSKDEWRIALSPEAKELTKKPTEGIGGFLSCEAAVIPFLPDARILRLHTKVDVDWSYTATLLQASTGGSLKLVSSGRGMVAHPKPDSAESISALNFLLRGVKSEPDVETIRELTSLYFFILDNEDERQFLGGRPIVRELELLNREPGQIPVEMGNDRAQASFLFTSWRLNFSLGEDSIQLVSASRLSN
jgi:hypothetical protein